MWSFEWLNQFNESIGIYQLMREKKKKKTYIVDVENLAYKNSFISLDISIFFIFKTIQKMQKIHNQQSTDREFTIGKL